MHALRSLYAPLGEPGMLSCPLVPVVETPVLQTTIAVRKVRQSDAALSDRPPVVRVEALLPRQGTACAGGVADGIARAGLATPGSDMTCGVLRDEAARAHSHILGGVPEFLSFRVWPFVSSWPTRWTRPCRRRTARYARFLEDRTASHRLGRGEGFASSAKSLRGARSSLHHASTAR